MGTGNHPTGQDSPTPTLRIASQTLSFENTPDTADNARMNPEFEDWNAPPDVMTEIDQTETLEF
jgi:hypothetical protein